MGETFQEPQHGRFSFRIQPARRLVKDQQAQFIDQFSGRLDAAPFIAAEPDLFSPDGAWPVYGPQQASHPRIPSVLPVAARKPPR